MVTQQNVPFGDDATLMAGYLYRTQNTSGLPIGKLTFLFKNIGNTAIDFFFKEKIANGLGTAQNPFITPSGNIISGFIQVGGIQRLAPQGETTVNVQTNSYKLGLFGSGEQYNMTTNPYSFPGGIANTVYAGKRAILQVSLAQRNLSERDDRGIDFIASTGHRGFGYDDAYNLPANSANYKPLNFL